MGLVSDLQLALDHHGLIRQPPDGDELRDLQRNAPVDLQLPDESLIEVAGRGGSIPERGDHAEAKRAGGGQGEPAEGALSRLEHQIAAQDPEDQRQPPRGYQHASPRHLQRVVAARVIRPTASDLRIDEPKYAGSGDDDPWDHEVTEEG